MGRIEDGPRLESALFETATDDISATELQMWYTAVDIDDPRAVLRVPSSPLSRKNQEAVLRT